jgi:hypothetical protein
MPHVRLRSSDGSLLLDVVQLPALPQGRFTYGGQVFQILPEPPRVGVEQLDEGDEGAGRVAVHTLYAEAAGAAPTVRKDAPKRPKKPPARKPLFRVYTVPLPPPESTAGSRAK